MTKMQNLTNNMDYLEISYILLEIAIILFAWDHKIERPVKHYFAMVIALAGIIIKLIYDFNVLLSCK